MTARTQLAAVLPGVSAGLLTQFGDAATVYVPVTTRAADNSAQVVWRLADGVASPVPVLPEQMTDARRQQLWGLESKATLTGYIADGAGVLADMIVAFASGSFAGRAFAVADLMPDDVGGVRTLALVETPLRTVVS